MKKWTAVILSICVLMPSCSPYTYNNPVDLFGTWEAELATGSTLRYSFGLDFTWTATVVNSDGSIASVIGGIFSVEDSENIERVTLERDGMQVYSTSNDRFRIATSGELTYSWEDGMQRTFTRID